jgi:hypothetical protein
VRNSFANKQNSTAKGWSSGAQRFSVEPEFSPCVHKKKSIQKYFTFSSAAQDNIPIFKKNRPPPRKPVPSLLAEPSSQRAP